MPINGTYKPYLSGKNSIRQYELTHTHGNGRIGQYFDVYVEAINNEITRISGP